MPKHRSIRITPILCLLVIAGNAFAQDPARDLMSDTWTAVDSLGRALPMHDECGPPRDGKTAGVFYFLWLGQHSRTGPWDITKLLAENPDNPRYGPQGHFHHWGEPEFGYYVSDDRFVIRKHAQALSDAGVDVLFIDVTNGFTYDRPLLVLCDELTKMRAEGNATPSIAFLTNSRSERVVAHLHDTFYKPGKYRDLWFMWDGRPLMLAKQDGLSDEILAFFTLRQSWAWTKGQAWFGDGQDKWPWVDHYPQTAGWHERGLAEQVPVAVAQHPVSNIGRSFHDGKQPAPAEERTGEGACFAEQWRGAIEADPKLVFITGWNEWVAQRFIAKDRPQRFLNGHAMPGETYFVDQYDAEFSRDIEPVRGGHADNYYWQMVDGVRRFKGVRPLPSPTPPTAIAIDGRFDDWDDVGPEYRDTIGDTAHRDHEGWNETLHYKDTTGRNDLVTLKVANDAQSVYFLAETLEAITPSTDANWMLLFINADADHATGLHGYDFVVNRKVASPTQTSLHALDEAGNEHLVANDIRMAIDANRLELAIPREALGLDASAPLALDFHWADNIEADKVGGGVSPSGDEAFDLMDTFSRHGDSAPNRRFNYAFRRGE